MRDGGRFLDRVGDQLVDRERRIADAVDEGGVGAVFQQAPHQDAEPGSPPTSREEPQPPQPESAATPAQHTPRISPRGYCSA